MFFDLPFYKFNCCKMPLHELITKIAKIVESENKNDSIPQAISLLPRNIGKYRCFYASPEHELEIKRHFESLSKFDAKKSRRKLHSPLRTCPFNINLINQFFLQDLQYRSLPNIHMKILFSPKISPDYTVLMIMGTGPWQTWLTQRTPDLETLFLRFRTNDKDESAIRELLLWQGDKRIRIVRVMKDPNWGIWADGPPQPFEEGKSYEKIKGKLIRDYFTFEDMIRFATNWGCPFDQEEFWTSDQPMYCLGKLENDEDFADWQEWPDGFSLEQ